MASLGKNIIANYVGRTWTTLLGILFIPIYLKFMGIEAYGLVGFYMALSSILGILDLGIGATINRELARLSANKETAGEQRDVVRTLELIYWGIAIFAGGVVILAAPYIAHTWIKAQSLDTESVLKAVRLMGFAVALQFPLSLYQGGLMGLQRQVLVNGILIVIGTLRSVGAILVLWLVSPTIDTFFVWQIISSIIGSVAFLIAMWLCLPRQAQRAQFKWGVLVGTWQYAAAISANAIVGVVLTQLDKIILSRMLTLEMFGYYSIAATVASAIWMIIIPFNTAIFPRFVQLYETKQAEELKILFHRASQIMSLLLFPVCAVLIFFSREILSLWMHDPLVVENCHLIVSCLVFGTMLNGIASIAAYSASAFSYPQLITYTNLIQAVVIVPLIVFMVYWLEGVGAAIAWVVLNSTFIIFMMPAYFRRYFRQEKMRWFFNDVLMPACTAFLICLVSKLIVPVAVSPLAISGWIIVTLIASVVLTGLILPQVRSLRYFERNNMAATV